MMNDQFEGHLGVVTAVGNGVEGRTMFRAIRFRAWPATHLLAATILAAVALSAATGAARAETADERDLRDHAIGNDLPAVQSRLAKGASPSVPDHSGRTAVHHAAAIA